MGFTLCQHRRSPVSWWRSFKSAKTNSSYRKSDVTAFQVECTHVFGSSASQRSIHLLHTEGDYIRLGRSTVLSSSWPEQWLKLNDENDGFIPPTNLPLMNDFTSLPLGWLLLYVDLTYGTSLAFVLTYSLPESFAHGQQTSSCGWRIVGKAQHHTTSRRVVFAMKCIRRPSSSLATRNLSTWCRFLILASGMRARLQLVFHLRSAISASVCGALSSAILNAVVFWSTAPTLTPLTLVAGPCLWRVGCQGLLCGMWC